MFRKFKIAKRFRLLTVLLFAALFVFSRVQAQILINEVMFDPKGSDGTTEWVELYSDNSDAQSLDGWDLDPDTGSYKNLDGKNIAGKSFLLIPGLSGMRNDKGQVSLYKSHTHNKDTIIDYMQYGTFDLGVTENVARSRAIDAKIWKNNDYVMGFAEGYSLERKDDGTDHDSSDDWQKSFVTDGTPGIFNSKYKKDTEPDMPKVQSDKIIINEILPYPNDGEKEFIELYNGGNSEEDLFGWTLHDGSISGEYKFSQHKKIGAKDFLVILEDDFGFALNNSSAENLTLRDATGEIASHVEYNGSKKGVSYNFNGNVWHWSKFLTPGKENIFEDATKGGMNLPEDVFVNVYADFEISGLEKSAKVTWDFGDGHKSYLAYARHKYAEEGKYEGNVKFPQGSEDITENFTVEVRQIAHPKIKIIAINANPKGSDTGLEFLTIQSKDKKKSKRKINLKGWSIATCLKKCINHPIREDFKIKGKKTKNITSDFSSFTLNNTKAKIELRYPDGKVAQRIKYKKKTGTIADDEIYQKVKGGWEWIAPVASEKSIKQDSSSVISPPRIDKQTSLRVEAGQQSMEVSQEITNDKLQTPNNTQDSINNIQNPAESEKSSVESQIIVNENEEISKEHIPTEKVENKFIEIKNENLKIELLKAEPKVLGASTIRIENDQYFFTQEATEQEHYVVMFLKNISANLNEKMNSFLTYLWK